MKTLPNGITVFNATPHIIRFWREDWDEPVEVETDMVVNAVIGEQVVAPDVADELYGIKLVTPEFLPEDNDEIMDMLEDLRDRNIYVIGSIIAAQAYPCLVFGMIPAPGYERVAPAEKRMLPDKFTIF